MKQLAKPSTPPEFIDYLVNIRDAKKSSKDEKNKGIDPKTLLTNSHAEISTCYAELEKAVENGSLHSITASAKLKAISDSLRSCYSGSTKGILAIKALIKEAQVTRLLKYCPMCGTTLPKTHDHYLPASVFPEYAVHPLNLVPCCSTCNSTKDDDWLDAIGNRRYMHFYSDEWPEENFLHVSLHQLEGLKGVGAKFLISRPPGFTGNWSLIESHYKRLDLINRFTEQGNDEIDEILADCAIHLESGGTDAIGFLKARAEERAEIYGESNWRVQLMRELAKADELENWIGLHRKEIKKGKK
jgi:hypothetical protein